MPRSFSHSTAEQVVQVADAINVKGKADIAFIESFCALSTAQVTNALGLAEDLALVRKNGAEYESANPLNRFFSTPEGGSKSAALRIVLETYSPFLVFRDRLAATNVVDTAAQQTKTLLDLDAHRVEIKDTLISLGTYAGALTSVGGGRYSSSTDTLTNHLVILAKTCDDLVSAEDRIRIQIGTRNNLLDRDEVIIPLSRALLKSKNGRAADAVTDAAIAIESFLVRLAAKVSIPLTGATGINSKLEKFRSANHLPKKIVDAGKYLGHLRNAADHGVDIDPDVNAVWRIQQESGLQYVFVACSFIKSCLERDAGGDFII